MEKKNTLHDSLMPRTKNKEIKIVGIGASAGGLEALQTFFDHIPSNNVCAYVVVQHLSPDFESLMKELLQKHTSLAISVIEEDITVLPNQVYLIPRKKNIIYEDGKLKPIPQQPNSRPNLPIDIFFHSLGHNAKERAIGIIMSGTGTDGSRGSRTIKEFGGLVMVQDPETAKFDGMPKAILMHDLQDFMLSPAGLASEVTRLVENSIESHHQMVKLEESFSHKVIARILKKVESISKIDFSYYRKPTIFRRIEKRMNINNVKKLEEYEDIIDDLPGEGIALVKDFLIGVTKFFRDAAGFQILEEQVIPQLLRNRETHELVRIWIVGCSTGEEAYSIAMLINEYLEANNVHREYKIFATDVNKDVIDFASMGVYHEEIIHADLPEPYIEKYFTKKHNHYQVTKSLRGKIVFAVHNALKDPPFINVELISCRNFLIYLETSIQKKLLVNFHFALNLNGFLFLGPSETIGSLKNAFKTIDSKWNVFRNILEVKMPQVGSVSEQSKKHVSVNNIAHSSERLSIDKTIPAPTVDVFSEILVEHYSPTCIFVNQQLDVLYINGEIEKYFHFPQRILKMNLIQMVDSENSLVFRNGVRRAVKDKEAIAYKGINFKKGEKNYALDLKFKVFKIAELNDYAILIELSDQSLLETTTPLEISEEDYQSERLKTLEQELKEAKYEKQSLVEQLESSNEELQASNEELLAANEEMQSTNEELQSVNEELYTVNTELQAKIKELTTANNDINNLLVSTDIGTIFLDEEFCIRRFTPAIQDQFSLNESDIGRPIAHFSSNLINLSITEQINKVLTTLVPIETEIENKNGKYYLQRILPYRTIENKIDGVVITYFDITELKKANKELSASEERFRLAIDGARDGIWDWFDVNEEKEWWSPQFYRLLGYEIDEIEPNLDNFAKLLHPDDTANTFEKVNNHLKEGIPFDTEYRLKTKSKGYKWFRAKATLTRDKKGNPVRMVGSISDIHEMKSIEQELKASDSMQRMIFESCLLGYWDWHIQKEYEYMSPAFKAMLGYEDEEVPNTPFWWQKNIHQEDLPIVLETFEEHVKSKGKVPYECTSRYLHKDGSIRWIARRGVVIEWGKGGKPIRMVGTHIDMTKQKSDEEELSLQTQRLATSNRELEQFAYVATHDMRSPSVNLQLLIKIFEEKGFVTDDSEPLFNKINTCAEQLNDTLHELIGIVKLKNSFNEEIQEINLENTLKEVMKRINEQHEKPAELILDFSKVESIEYIGGHIKSIFSNIYSNALKYRSKDRDLRVEVRSRRENDFIIISFQDNGIGFSMNKIEKIFGMFQRLHEKIDGKGVGLFAIKSLIESQGGKIQATSETDKGSIFEVFLKPLPMNVELVDN